MRVYLICFALSLILHIVAMWFIPGFDVMKLKPAEAAPVYVEVVPREKPKPAPIPVKKNTDKPSPVKPKDAPKPAPIKTEDTIPPQPEAKGTPEQFVLPDIVVPKSSVETQREIALPNVIDNAPVVKNPDVPRGKAVDSELAALEAAYGAKKETDQQKKNTTGSETILPSSGIYNFDVMPTNNRKIAYVPKDPDFSLGNDARVTIKFSIDKLGNTGDIEFVTRSSGAVEKLAADYVRNIRFSAVLHDEKDVAQITITFKVRSK